jgi:DNA-binding NtrC family response regulator
MKTSVLLVDDEPAILLTLKAILELKDFTVETAVSAAEAKRKLQSNMFDMVITDMRMETDAAGLEVVRIARELPGHPAIAIVTAYPDLGSDWRHQGAQDLLIKPMNAEEFLGRVDALLRQREQRRRRKRKFAARGRAITSKAN